MIRVSYDHTWTCRRCRFDNHDRVAHGHVGTGSEIGLCCSLSQMVKTAMAAVVETEKYVAEKLSHKEAS